MPSLAHLFDPYVSGVVKGCLPFWFEHHQTTCDHSRIACKILNQFCSVIESDQEVLIAVMTERTEAAQSFLRPIDTALHTARDVEDCELLDL